MPPKMKTPRGLRPPKANDRDHQLRDEWLKGSLRGVWLALAWMHGEAHDGDVSDLLGYVYRYGRRGGSARLARKMRVSVSANRSAERQARIAARRIG